MNSYTKPRLVNQGSITLTAIGGGETADGLGAS